MEREYFNEERYARAQKKIKEIKGFYWHLFWYLAVNIFITFGSTFGNFVRFGELEFGSLNFGMFSVWSLLGNWIGRSLDTGFREKHFLFEGLGGKKN